MYIVRDIFHLKFGHFKEANGLLHEALKSGLMPQAENTHILTDFTGDSYRMIFEEGFNSLGEYEQSLSSSMQQERWKSWYEQFKQHVEASHREILKQIL